MTTAQPLMFVAGLEKGAIATLVGLVHAGGQLAHAEVIDCPAACRQDRLGAIALSPAAALAQQQRHVGDGMHLTGWSNLDIADMAVLIVEKDAEHMLVFTGVYQINKGANAVHRLWRMPRFKK